MPAAYEHPSGRQYGIAHGDHEAVVVEVGGGLRTYSHRGFEVLDGYSVDDMCTAGRGQPLIPWPNRIGDGRYRFAGEALQLALTEPSRQTAIHGLLRWTAWDAVAQSTERVVMQAVLHPQPGYPFALLATADYSVGPRGLRVAISAQNVGRRALPYGAGQHPYVRAGEGSIDAAVVQSPARTVLEADDRGIPTGRRVPVAGEYDLSAPRSLGPRKLDTAFTDLDRSEDGLARLRVRGSEREVTVWMDAAFPHLMLFTGDTLAAGARRRGLAVEPMTCPPNAFQSGEDVVVLEPGASHTATWGISVAASSG